MGNKKAFNKAAAGSVPAAAPGPLAVEAQAMKRFFEAAQNGDVTALENILAQYPHAVAWRDTDSNDMTALMFAAQKGHIACLHSLIWHDADVDAQNARGSTALMFAAHGKQSRAVAELLANMADPNKENNEKSTALMVSAWAGDADVCKRLLAAGAVTDKKDSDNMTAYDHAIGSKNRDAADAIREAVRAAKKQPAVTTSVLIDAIAAGTIEEIRRLLQNGEKPNVTNERGSTPLMFAASRKRADVVDLLLEYKANPHHTNRTGLTALMVAASEGSETICNALIKKGVLVDACDADGMTALMYAVEKGRARASRVLLENGAENRENNSDESVVSIARSAGFEYLAARVENFKNQLSKTPAPGTASVVANDDTAPPATDEEKDLATRLRELQEAAKASVERVNTPAEQEPPKGDAKKVETLAKRLRDAGLSE